MAGDPPAKKDFFISYNKADREWAEWVAWNLEELGHYSVVIQAWDFRPGCNFVLEMDRAIKECGRVIALLSPDYLTSLFTQPEWAAYFVQDPTGRNPRIVPVRVRECELKGLLAPIVYTDIVGNSEKEAKAKLLKAAKSGRGKPQSPPDFPGRKIAIKPHFPGTLPDIWNVPHLRNPNFTEPGRRLSEMGAALRSGKPAALTQALAGLGGVGKTQLAIEYAYRYAADYTIVWWLRSEHAATLAADYAALATALNLLEKDVTEEPLIVEAVRNALGRRCDWLLIFDNANAPEAIRNYFPAMGGHILVTSRYPAWRSVAQMVPVRKWTPGVAARFLLKRTGHSDISVAKELARELDYLPLALEQAAAFIESAQKTLQSYLVMFRRHQLTLLNRGKPGTDYRATVETTWEFAFQRLERESPAGVALLRLCAFLAPDDIPRDVIIAGVKHLPEPLRKTVRDELGFDDAVGAIRRYSLIEANNTTFSMHRLVQAVVRDRLNPQRRQRWAEVAVKVVNKAFPSNSDDLRTWTGYDRLLPHAIVAMSLAEDLGVGLETIGRLTNQMGLYASERGKYQEAKMAFEHALPILEKTFGPNDLRVAISSSNLGDVSRNLGDFSRAKVLYERALRIEKKLLGVDHEGFAKTLNNLGLVLHDSGDFSGAKMLHERALRIEEKVFGVDHEEVARTVNNLGMALHGLGDLSGAKTACERALKIWEKALGPDHPKVAAGVNNLGALLKDLGDLTGARAAFERALTIEEKARGPEHPNVAICLSNLGHVLWASDDLLGAERAFASAAIIFHSALGMDHPHTQLAFKSLISIDLMSK